MNYTQQSGIAKRSRQTFVTFFKKKTGYVLIPAILVLYITSLIVDKKLLSHYRYIVLFALCITSISILMHYLRLLPKELIWLQVRKSSLFILILLMPLILLFSLHFIFYRENPIQQENALSFLGDYLTFTGASILGYTIYLRDQNYHKRLIQNKAKLLSASYSQSLSDLQSLETYASNKLLIHILPNWQEYYFDVRHLIQHHDSDFYNELQYVYQTIGTINKDIKNSCPSEVILDKYRSFLDREYYSTQAYNHIEVESILASIATCDNVPQFEPWSVKEADTIAGYASQFFMVVENWLFNHLAYKLHLSRIPYSKVEHTLIAWLLKNPELNNWVTSPYDYRKIAAVALKIAISLNTQSTRLTFFWGEISIRHP